MRPIVPILAAALLTVAACGGGESASSSATPGATAAAPASAASKVPLTGTIIEVTMHTDDRGNYFEPANFSAKPGDVVRFKLVTGVHNVSFPADSNPGAAGLPAVSAYLQLPGQTLDIPMTFGTGEFFYQCDPHAMLGMVGRIRVAP